ncbi:nucleotide exchange factor GrpE [Jejudonia soesokkakensis]|uniref:Protein GrpE n=1 Tax=Jejudonia soesokkakensis TaxID=1323432 RepID=A0ABW2MXL8_9FLAO
MSKKEKIKEVVEDEVLTNNETSSEEKAKVSEEKEDEIDPIESLQTELNNERDKFLRLFAEFENFKKRTGKERIELFKTAGREIIEAMLPILDDFDRAMKEFSNDSEDVHVQGMSLIHAKLKETLKNKGLQVAETNQGDTFDAEIHEAITQIPAPSEDLKGKIIDVVEKGYMLGEKIIRYPKVVIGQ